ncbi:hypothetical protein Bca4012_066105 [Brassica carinata]|uniref:ATP-dependent Clp protease proteolytic subunit n=1 Tax=Brassica carinata TaxID=52824 RepID=A0A8X7VPW1_BRACI|nr:hypothetical protein Bca52824_018388 [Brassica carinata]
MAYSPRIPEEASLATSAAPSFVRSESLNPLNLLNSKPKRGVVTMVIPFSKGSAHEQPPHDLASYFFKTQIVYLGMSFVTSVTELILAEFLYLQYEDEEKPIYLYINSTGTTKVKLYSKHIGKSPEQIKADIKRPKYLVPVRLLTTGLLIRFGCLTMDQRGIVEPFIGTEPRFELGY